MVSYVRARAEGSGYECDVGMMLRPERIAYISVGAIIGKLPIINELFLIVAIWVISILSNVTAIQRIIYVYKISKKMSEDSAVEVDSL